MFESRPRRLFARIDCRDKGLFALLRDLPVRAQVLDWSEGGISLALTAPSADLVPGQPLEARLIAGEQVLGTLDLLVRRVDREGARVRIGASIQPHAMAALWRASSDGAQKRPIRGEAFVESFFRTLFRLPEQFSVRGTGKMAWLDLRVAPKGILARPETFELLCPQAGDIVGLVAGQPLEVLVLALGAPYLLQTELVAVFSDRLALRLPGRLFSLTRRDGARVKCSADQPCFFDAPHPLLPGRFVRFRVRDLSPSGLSLLPESDLPLWPGSIQGGRLFVPFSREMDVDLVAGPVRTDADGAVVAGRFAKISDEDRRALGDYLLATAFPDIHDRGRFDAWGVWEFLRGAGYLPAQAGDTPPARTWDCVRHAGPSLSHDVVRFSGGAIVGHMSCLRLYRRTWLVHQLAVSPQGAEPAAGAALYDYGASFLETRKDEMSYMIAYYNRTLPWHRMFFAGYERRMADPDLAVIHPFGRYLVETTGIVLDRVRDRSTISPIDAEDVAETSAFLRRAIPETALRALDLDEATLLGEEAARAYAEQGLEWKRVVLAQRREGRLIGVAVCELATPGLNAVGITDMAKVVCEPLDAEEAAIAHRALLARIKGFFLAHHRERFFLLLDPSCSGEALEAAGAVFVETTGFVAFSRAGLLDFRAFVQYEFARLDHLRGRKPPEGFGVLGSPGTLRAGG